MECSICLNTMDNKDNIFILSCNHKFHYKCFLKYSYQIGHLYIDCPLCRDMNFNIQLPILDSESNLKNLLFHNRRKRCCAINKTNGKRCKKNSILMNYDYCNIHHSDILPKNKYHIINSYIFFKLIIKCSWYSKIIFIDLARKLLIQYPEINSFQELLSYSFRYKFYLFKLNLNNTMIHKYDIFKYYNLKEPSLDWLNKCHRDKTIH